MTGKTIAQITKSRTRGRGGPLGVNVPQLRKAVKKSKRKFRKKLKRATGKR